MFAVVIVILLTNLLVFWVNLCLIRVLWNLSLLYVFKVGITVCVCGEIIRV